MFEILLCVYTIYNYIHVCLVFWYTSRLYTYVNTHVSVYNIQNSHVNMRGMCVMYTLARIIIL